MDTQVIVLIPGRIPHAVPQDAVERFLKDHPGAQALAQADAPAPEKPRRTRAKARPAP